MSSTHGGYVTAGLCEAVDKGFEQKEVFVVLGTEVNSNNGEVGVPMSKRVDISHMLAWVVHIGRGNKKCLQKALGLVVYPLCHRRAPMSCLHTVYIFVDDMPDDFIVRLPTEATDDLLAALLLMFFAASSIRHPISNRITCTDVTPINGGRCRLPSASGVCRILVSDRGTPGGNM